MPSNNWTISAPLANDLGGWQISAPEDQQGEMSSKMSTLLGKSTPTSGTKKPIPSTFDTNRTGGGENLPPNMFRNLAPLAVQGATALATGGMSMPAQMGLGALSYFGAKEGLDKIYGDHVQSVFDLTGQPDVDNLIEAGGNEVIGKGISKIADLGRGVLSKLAPRDASMLSEDITAQSGDSFSRSMGQMSGNKKLQSLERRYGGQKAAELANIQRQATDNELSKLGTNNPLVTQKQLVQNYFDVGDKVDNLYKDFRTNHLANNVVNLQQDVPNPNYVPNQSFTRDASGNLVKDANNSPTISQTVQIHGPIYLPETSKLAQQIKPKIDAFLSSEAYQNLPAPAQSKFKMLSAAIDNFSSHTPVTLNGQQTTIPVKEFEAVKNWRTIVGSMLSQDQKIDLPKGTLLALKNTLGNDIQESIGGMWHNGPAVLKDLSDANAAHASFMDTFDSSLKKKLFKGAPQISRNGSNLADPATLYNNIGNSPDVARQFINALGPEHANLAKGGVVGKLIESSIDTANHSFSPDTFINKLQAPGYRELFSAPERANLELVMRSLRTAKPEDLAGTAGMAFKEGLFHLAIPAALLTGHISGAGLGIATVSIAPRIFAQRVLLNPRLARMAVSLPYKSGASTETGLITKSIMAALKGVQVSLNTGDSTTPVTVGENGELK